MTRPGKLTEEVAAAAVEDALARVAAEAVAAADDTTAEEALLPIPQILSIGHST